MWSSCRLLTGIGACIGLGIGTVYMKIGTIQAESFQEINDRLSNCPYLVWNYDWDRRASKTKTKDGKYQIDASKNSKYARTIWLINDVQHQRDEDDAKQEPTDVGRQQLQKLSNIMRKITQTDKIKWEAVYYSTTLRSRAQAEIIKKSLDGDVKMKAMSSLVEGVPVLPSPKVSDIPCVSPEITFQDHPRIESFFLTIFHRADANQKGDSHELVIAHPNVIRYLVCRVLQMPPEAFSRFHLFHGSITRIKINGNGTVVLEVLGDAGYLPPNLLTSGEIGGAPPVLVDPDDVANEEILTRMTSIVKAVEGTQDK